MPTGCAVIVWLNEVAYFHVCNGSLVPDVMHDILEGALQYEVKLILQFMIDTEKYFTLEELNTRLERMELGDGVQGSTNCNYSCNFAFFWKLPQTERYKNDVYILDAMYFTYICYFQLYSCPDVALRPDSSDASRGSCS